MADPCLRTPEIKVAGKTEISVSAASIAGSRCWDIY
jgi:hypothetical protein